MHWIRRSIIAAPCIVGALLCAVAGADPSRAKKKVEIARYPMEALRRGVEGEVLVEFRVDGDGAVVEPKINRSAPQGIFDEAVLKGLTRWRYDMQAPGAGELQEKSSRVKFVFQVTPCALASHRSSDFAVAPTDVNEEMLSCAGGIKSSQEADAFFKTDALREQIRRPAYVSASQAVAADASTIESERTVPRDSGERPKRRTQLPIPIVSAQMRRDGVARLATVTFDIDGSGRVKNVLAPGRSGPDQDLAIDLGRAVSLWLFEPRIENGTGIGRVGFTASLSVEFDDPGRSSCGQLKAAIPVDFEERVCFQVRGARQGPAR